jgi:hypothetical protein
MDISSQGFTPGTRESYADERSTRRHRRRVVGFSVCIALWLLSAVPLARLSSDDGGGAGVAVAYLVAGIGVALVTRGIYAHARRRSFWSPWLFVTAAVLALMSYGGLTGGERTATPGSGEAATTQIPFEL